MCKVRFSTITKRDLVRSAEPAAASRKRGRGATTPKPEKVRVKRRDARFFDDPNDYHGAADPWASALRHIWAPPSPPPRDEDDDFPFLPFWGGGRTPLDFFLRRHRAPSPPPPLPYPLPFPHLAMSRSSFMPRPTPERPAALGPPPLIDLTDEAERTLRPGAVTLIDLTGEGAPIEVLSDSDDDDASLVEQTPAPAAFRPVPLRPSVAPQQPHVSPLHHSNPLAPPPAAPVYRPMLPRPSVDV